MKNKNQQLKAKPQQQVNKPQQKNNQQLKQSPSKGPVNIPVKVINTKQQANGNNKRPSVNEKKLPLKKFKKEESEDEDDEDDDEDDEDDDEDEDDDDDDDDDDEDDDDEEDDDDDDDDDDEDEDEEDDDDEEDEPPVKNKKLEVKKVEPPTKTKLETAKAADTTKKVDTKKPVESAQKSEAVVKKPQTAAETKELDDRTLFIKNLPAGVTETDIKALSSDITAVRIKLTKRLNGKKNKGKPSAFVFVEFASKELAEKNYKEMQNKKVKGKEIFVDYVGDRSNYVKKEEKEKQKDLKKLHIGGFDKSAKEDELKKLFSSCVEFTLPVKKNTNVNIGFAFAAYNSEADAKKALEATNGKDFGGKKLKVDYAYVRSDKKVEPAAKKQKVEETKAVDIKKAAVVAVKQEAGKKETAVAKGAPKVAEVPKNQLKRKFEDEDDDDDDESDIHDDDDEDDDDSDEEEEDDDDEDEDDDDDDDDDDDEESEDEVPPPKKVAPKRK